jgi:hypothetical protein
LKRIAVSDTTWKSLIALNGNECAMPDCSNTLIYENNKFRGKLCHIEAYSPEGPRFNSNLSTKERNDISNLIIFCPNCHDLVDADPKKFNIEDLKKMKIEHEQTQKNKGYVVPDNIIKILKVSINEDEFKLDVISTFIQIYNSIDDLTVKDDFFENRLEYTLKNLKLQTIENYEIIEYEMIGILDSILNFDESKILCLLTTIIGNNNFPNEILDKFLKKHNKFIIGLLDKNRNKRFLTSLFWKIHENDKDMFSYFLTHASFYEYDVYDDLIRTLDLKKLERDDLFERYKQLWKELDKISDKKGKHYKNLKQLENKVFEALKTNSTN